MITTIELPMAIFKEAYKCLIDSKQFIFKGKTFNIVSLSAEQPARKQQYIDYMHVHTEKHGPKLLFAEVIEIEQSASHGVNELLA